MDIKKVVVIGSGTMGSGIAAHLCNANVPVTLLDLTTEISEKARDRIFKSKPPLLLDKSQIENIKVGNINDNFDVVNNRYEGYLEFWFNGVRQTLSNLNFNEYFYKFYENVFFPTLKERGITTCVHMGDVVDRRKFISFRIANDFRKRFDLLRYR